MTVPIVQNPTLTGYSVPPTQFTDHNGNVGYIENPDGWLFVFDRLADTRGNLPQSLHRDRGYCIAAGWRKWQAGYQQTIEVKEDQRYLAKAVFKVNMKQPHKPIDWHFVVSHTFDNVAPDGSEKLGERINSAWSQNVAGYGREEEHLFVFQARRDMTLDLRFEARSLWDDNECDFNIYLITVEPVAADYGGANVQYIGTAQPPVPTPTPIPVPVPTPTPIPPVNIPPGYVLVPSGIIDKLRAIAGQFNELADLLGMGRA